MPDRQPDNRPHLELVLRQIESLPTLPVVATRLLRLTASDESIVREVVDLISSDPTLTARILSLCRRADLPVRSQVLTVQRAVVLLGFDAVRNDILSIKVLDLFAGNDDAFDKCAFWRHSLAVAIAAELMVRSIPAPGRSERIGSLHRWIAA